MLTPEQTTIRLRDAEITRLRKENEHLTARVKTVLKAFSDLIRYIAENYIIGYLNKAKVISMLEGLEEDAQ